MTNSRPMGQTWSTTSNDLVMLKGIIKLVLCLALIKLQFLEEDGISFLFIYFLEGSPAHLELAIRYTPLRLMALLSIHCL